MCSRSRKSMIPRDAAVFAVGDGFQPDGFLLADHAFDFAILDRLEGIGGDLAALALLPRLFQRGGAQQAADVIGAERRLGSLHGQRSAICIIFLARHDTSPSPHWGEGEVRGAGLSVRTPSPPPSPPWGEGADGASGHEITCPTPRPPIPRSSAASPIARLRTEHCLPRSRRSRIAATGKADRARHISSPRRCGA